VPAWPWLILVLALVGCLALLALVVMSAGVLVADDVGSWRWSPLRSI